MSKYIVIEVENDVEFANLLVRLNGEFKWSSSDSPVNTTVSVSSPKSGAKASVKPFEPEEGKDYTYNFAKMGVSFTVKGSVVTIDGYIRPKDIFKNAKEGILVEKATALGGKWVSDSKAFYFPNEKNAKAFASITEITDSERRAVWATWNK